MLDSNFMERLNERIMTFHNPSLLGLDPQLAYLPEYLLRPLEGQSGEGLSQAIAAALTAYNRELLEACADIIPAVKFQMAYYEQYGLGGLQALQASLDIAHQMGYLIIVDAKRNDIGATAGAYAQAFITLAETPYGQKVPAFQGDALTVNFYLGSDGVQPFAKSLRETGKGIFLLLRTSNPSGQEIQDLILADGRKLYESLAERAVAWAEEYRQEGESYSPIGLVVGATYPKEAEKLRRHCPHLFFLVPGYGAQGAGASDVAAAFSKQGGGAIVNSSRGLMNAYKDRKMPHESFAIACREAALEMRADLSAFVQ